MALALSFVQTAAMDAVAQTPTASAPKGAASGQAPGPAPTASIPATAASAPRFALSDGTVRIPVAGLVSVATLTVTQLDQADLNAKLIAMEDVSVDVSDTSKVTFYRDKAVQLQSSGTTQTWAVPLSVTGLDINKQIQKYVHVVLGKHDVRFGYFLTNIPATTVDFGVTVHSPWELSGSSVAKSIQIDARDQPVSGLRVAMSQLTDQNINTSLETQSFRICVEPEGECTEPGTVKPNTTQTFYLRLAQQNHDRKFGLFKGSISLAAAAMAEPKVVSLDVASSAPWVRMVGALVLILSVLGAFWMNVYSKQLVTRLSELRPAVMAREAIESMLASVREFERDSQLKLNKLTGALESHRDELTEDNLNVKNYLPGPWGTLKGYDAANLKQLLTQIETFLKTYTVVVRNGIDVIHSQWLPEISTETANSLASAAQALDLANVQDEAAARTLVDAALKHLSSNSRSLFGLKFDGGSQPSLSSRQIVGRIESVNRAGWLFYMAISAGAGILLLVLKPQGFGTWLDFAFCVFWGFGLPTTMDKVMQLKSSDVATNLGLSIPT
jgi:hypothetical protein